MTSLKHWQILVGSILSLALVTTTVYAQPTTNCTRMIINNTHAPIIMPSLKTKLAPGSSVSINENCSIIKILQSSGSKLNSRQGLQVNYQYGANNNSVTMTLQGNPNSHATTMSQGPCGGMLNYHHDTVANGDWWCVPSS